MRRYVKLSILFTIVCGLYVACIVFSWQLALTVGLIVLGTLGYFEKIFDIRWSRKSRIILVIVFLGLSISQMTYSHLKEYNLSHKLMLAEDTALKAEKQIKALVADDRDLRERLREAEKAAVKATQKAELLQYQDVAIYNATGNKSGAINGVRMVPSPIDDWDQRFVTRHDAVINFDCNSDAIDACRSVIKKVPLYPFSHYFLAKCLKERRDPLWREHALKARQIFASTVALPGHHRDHELAAKELTEMLKE